MNADFEAYARYISTTWFFVRHLVESIGGTILAIFGAVTLGTNLANSAMPSFQQNCLRN
jgi:hypothetical protein